MTSKKRSGLLKFGMGLRAMDYYLFPAPPYRGRTWTIQLGKPRPELGGTYSGDAIYPPRDVVILAQNVVNAQRAANLIHSAHLVLDGSAFFSDLHPGENVPIRSLRDVSHSSNEPNGYAGDGFRMVAPHIPLACMVAARASFRLSFIYALIRLRLSLEIFSLPFIELDPTHSQTIPKSPFAEDHARLAFAIVAAWSCIEELGFEVRASSKKPSVLEDGAWNPPVKFDLERRLSSGHVNLSERFYWSLRGKPTRIESKKPPQISKKARWSRYDIRDGEMEVIDAINLVSFMRSQIATHKADKQMLRVLSVYDVANAQFLARRLLLERLRYWRFL